MVMRVFPFYFRKLCLIAQNNEVHTKIPKMSGSMNNFGRVLSA